MTPLEQIAARLYLDMPGAPANLEGVPMDNDHWRFCEAIAREILNVVIVNEVHARSH